MTNTKPKITIVNCTTGETFVRDANDAELAQMKLDEQIALERKTKAEAKVEAKAAAQAKLAAIGLTVEDLTALGL